jgi:hypothetical protein
VPGPNRCISNLTPHRDQEKNRTFIFIVILASDKVKESGDTGTKERKNKSEKE